MFLRSSPKETQVQGRSTSLLSPFRLIIYIVNIITKAIVKSVTKLSWWVVSFFIFYIVIGLVFAYFLTQHKLFASIGIEVTGARFDSNENLTYVTGKCKEIFEDGNLITIKIKGNVIHAKNPPPQSLVKAKADSDQTQDLIGDLEDASRTEIRETGDELLGAGENLSTENKILKIVMNVLFVISIEVFRNAKLLWNKLLESPKIQKGDIIQPYKSGWLKDKDGNCNINPKIVYDGVKRKSNAAAEAA
jgi:hypothetical protein